jgi:hypothetical protein
MAVKYQSGQYSRIHLEEVDEICDLRKQLDRPCIGCIHDGLADCPKVRNIIVKDTIRSKSYSGNGRKRSN